jgi:hypothetical protein
VSTLKFFTALAAVVSPWWLPIVSHVSEVAATLLPILGCTWIIIQILAFFVKKKGQ